MATTTAIFTSDVEAFAKAIDVNMQTVMRSIALRLWTKITQRTPVDTGRARSNWALAEGGPSSLPPPLPGDSHTTVTPNVQFISGKGAIFITNNLGYVQYLEQGSSKQAPVGMVAISVAELEAEIETYLEQILAGQN